MGEPEVLYKGKYIQFVKRDGWEYAERVGITKIACIAPFIVDYSDIKAVLIKEYRPTLQKYVISFPAGLIGDTDKDEELIVGAQRELIEETGYTGRLRYLTHGPPSCGLSNEVLHFYLADKLRHIGNGGGDGTENIEVILISKSNLGLWLVHEAKKEDIVIDPKIYVGLYYENILGTE